MDTPVPLDDIRQRAPDHATAAAFAPRQVQADLITLAGFVGELDHIVMTVTDPVAGELRLQWWRDTVVGTADGARTGHALADAVSALLRRLDWPDERLHRLIDAHADTLYADRPVDDAAFAALLDRRFVEPMRMAASLIGGANVADRDGDATDIHGTAGAAYGCMRMAVSYRHFRLLGRNPLPPSYDSAGDEGARPANLAVPPRLISDARAGLKRVSSAFSVMSRPARVAVLPVAVVEPHLQVLQRTAGASAGDAPAPPVEIAPLRRFGRMLWSYTTGRL